MTDPSSIPHPEDHVKVVTFNHTVTPIKMAYPPPDPSLSPDLKTAGLLGVDQERSTTSSRARRHGIFRLTSDDGIDIGVFATSAGEAVRLYNETIAPLDCDVDVERIPASREVRISLMDDNPEAEDVPRGGRIEPVPGYPQYLSIVATASQWCAFYRGHGRDFIPMWEAE